VLGDNIDAFKFIGNDEAAVGALVVNDG